MRLARTWTYCAKLSLSLARYSNRGCSAGGSSLPRRTETIGTLSDGIVVDPGLALAARQGGEVLDALDHPADDRDVAVELARGVADHRVELGAGAGVRRKVAGDADRGVAVGGPMRTALGSGARRAGPPRLCSNRDNRQRNDGHRRILIKSSSNAGPAGYGSGTRAAFTARLDRLPAISAVCYLGVRATYSLSGTTRSPSGSGSAFSLSSSPSPHCATQLSTTR